MVADAGAVLRSPSGPAAVGALAVQTIIVAIWIGVNVVAFTWRFDPYPFILLNLVFSTQAAYAAPLILLAQRPDLAG